MTLLPTLTPAANVKTGRLKFVAGDVGTLVGLQTPQFRWVLCNGAAVPNSGIYVALYAMLGTRFGAAGTLPTIIDGRVPIPKGATNFPTAGVSGGEINHVLSLSEYPSHTHTYADAATAAGDSNLDGWDPWDRGGVGRTSNGFGGGGSHPNMSPYTVCGAVLVSV